MITPFNLNVSKEIDIDEVSFNALGVKFIGDGTLSWDLKEGFGLKAKLKPNRGIELKGKKSYGGAKVQPKKLFRFIINKMWKAYTVTSFSEWLEIPLSLNAGKFTIGFDNLILYSDAIFNNQKDVVRGKCFFILSKGTQLPDLVFRETKLLDDVVFQSTEFAGLFVQDEFIKIQGYLNEDEVLEVSWEINEGFLSKRTQWEIAIAIRDALSICLGQVVTVVRRDLYRNNKSIIEFIKKQETINLGYFSPINSSFNKAIFLILLKALMRNDNKSVVIRKLFYQIADSLKVNSFAIWQFMIATSLEAFLRTYFNKPFQIGKKNDSFKGVEYHLTEFKREYFENDYLKEWRNVFKKVNQCYSDLRHINAHPDWLNSLNSETNQKKLDSMRYLSKFYGYVILALAGYRNLKPEIKI